MWTIWLDIFNDENEFGYKITGLEGDLSIANCTAWNIWWDDENDFWQKFDTVKHLFIYLLHYKLTT